MLYALFPAAALLSAGVVVGILANSESVGLRKGRLVRAAWCLVGCSLCLLATPVLIFNWRQPVLSVDGAISSAVVHSSGRSHPTDLTILTGDGRIVHLRASDRSTFFRTGQIIEAKYQTGTGFILHANFLSQDGKQEGVFNGTAFWWPYFTLIGGLLVIGYARWNFRRDPEGQSRGYQSADRQLAPFQPEP